MWKDLFFSFLLHALVLAMMVTFALWKEQKRDEPLKRIAVTIVSDKELATLQQRANPVTRPKIRSIQARTKTVEPESIKSPQAAPKSAIKPVPASRPVLKPEAAPRPAIKPQTAPRLETVLKPKSFAKPVVSPEAAPEPIVYPEQASKPVAKFKPAMKPVIKFEPAAQAVVRLETPAKPVLKLKAEPIAVMDMEALSQPIVDMEPRPVPVTSADSGPLPLSRPKQVSLPKSALKSLAASMAKPVVKLRPIAKPETDPNYDPFAPMESATDRQRRPKAEKIESLDSFQSALTRITERRLSQKEIDRYIARIQAAVERHWKVPVATENITDPLVEMVLQPSGHIRSLMILESSGNAALNASLIRAIQAAAPFELPKEQFEHFRVNRIRFHPF